MSLNKINFNGEEVLIGTEIKVARFLQQQAVADGRFVVVINDEVVHKSDYDTVMIKQGDVIEMLSPITGG